MPAEVDGRLFVVSALLLILAFPRVETFSAEADFEDEPPLPLPLLLGAVVLEVDCGLVDSVGDNVL